MEHTKTKYTSDISDVDNMDGFEFEAFCCELLRQNGYKNVRKTQARGDYGLDVIATTKDGFVCGIQCKNYQGTVGIAAVQEAKTGSDYYNCDIAIVLTNSTFTKAAVDLAQKTNVKLWNRNKLKELIKVFPEKIVEQPTDSEINKTDTKDKDYWIKTYYTPYVPVINNIEAKRDFTEYDDIINRTTNNGSNKNNVTSNDDKGWIWGCLIGIVLLIIVGILIWKFWGWFIPVIVVILVLIGLGVASKK